MPVPLFNEDVQPQPLRKVRPIPGFDELAPDAAFGGGKQGNYQMPLEAGENIDRHKDDAYKAQAMLLHQKYVDEMINNTEGALSIHGDAALGYSSVQDPNSWMSKSQKLEEKYSEMATNPQVKSMLAVMMGATRNTLHETVSKHAGGEIDYLNITAGKGDIDAITRQAVLDPSHVDDYLGTDGKKHAGYATQIKAIALQHGKAVDAEKYVTQMHDLVLRSMITSAKTPQDLANAEKFQQGHSMPSLSEDKSVEKLQTLVVADKAAKDAFDKYGGDLIKAQKEFESLPEDQQKEANRYLLTLGKNKESMTNLTALDAARDAMDQITKWQKANPGQIATPQDVLGAGVFASLGGNDVKLKNALQTQMRHVMDPMYAGDSDKLADFLSDKEAMARMDKREFAEGILQHLNSQQQSVAKAAYESMHPKNGGVGSPTRDMAKADWMKAAIVGIMPQDERVKPFAKWPSKYKTLYANLDSNIKSEEAYHYSANKKLPELDEVKTMINNQLLNMYEQSSMMGFKHEDQFYANVKAGTVPMADFDKVKSAFTKFTPTTDQVFRAYQAIKNKDPKTLDQILNGEK